MAEGNSAKPTIQEVYFEEVYQSKGDDAEHCRKCLTSVKRKQKCYNKRGFFGTMPIFKKYTHQFNYVSVTLGGT